MPNSFDRLTDVRARVDAGENPRVTVREFLSWFGFERRGWRVVKQIRVALNRHGLITQPDFEFEWIDGELLFATAQQAATPAANLPEIKTPLELADEVVVVLSSNREDPTYRLGKLDAANNPPVRITPDATVQEAITIMLRDDFSQLAVMTSDREVKGAITWRSIAKHAGLGRQCEKVRECMELQVEIVGDDVSLFGVIELVRANDFVLVRNAERRIIGIVTVSDLSQSLHQLGQPFLLLSEIENHIRSMIDGRFTAAELDDCKNPNDPDRTISDVSDLTFGEYVRLLQNPARWGKIGLAIDRNTFIKDLERVNQIRNDVMHFDPDGIGDDDLQYLSKTAKFVQELRSLAKE